MNKYKISVISACILLSGLIFSFRNPSLNYTNSSGAWQLLESPEHKTMAIGTPAPDFSLPGIDGKTYTLASFKDAKILVIVFTCNHCATAQAYEDRIIKLADDYTKKGVAIVAINPNDPKSLALEELDFSDLGDSFEDMKIRAKDKHFNFPYLYDGETEATSNKFGPVATPHVFIFDKARKLRYSGRVDDTEKPSKTPQVSDTRNAIEALLAGREVQVATTKVFGCSIKWSDKRGLVTESDTKWAQRPVNLEVADEKMIKEIIKNSGDKLRLVNVWATWCGPCTKEFPDFIDMQRMYDDRDFEFVSISADDQDKKDKALKFLQKHQAASKNYLFSADNKYKLIEAIDPSWQGALPYTMLIEPGGNVVYRHEGAIDPAEMKRIIVSNKMIGHYP